MTVAFAVALAVAWSVQVMDLIEREKKKETIASKRVNNNIIAVRLL